MRIYLLPLLFFGFAPVQLLADVTAEIGLEARYFFQDGLFSQDKLHPSLRGEVEYEYAHDNNSFEVVGFARVDAEDSERSHVDLREAAWTHVADNWELKVGVSKVFWGVTESRHLVDVINQTDAVENLDGEDKLGQPMTKLSFERDWGTVDVFWLPYFRERTFAGENGRLRLPLVVDTDEAVYASGAKRWHSDFAMRYSHYIGDFDFAFSHFSGTSRDPVLAFNGDFANPMLLPVYYTVDQTGLELQYIFDEWLFKLEGITNSGLEKRYSAAVFGFEYTQVGILDSQADLGWLLEYLFDDRKDSAPHSFEQDIFAGWRYAFNDADSSEILAGFIYDPETDDLLFSFEANRRLASDLKLNMEARFFAGGQTLDTRLPAVLANLAVPDSHTKTASFQEDSYLQLELVKYF